MPREIENVFIDLPGNNCFACHPGNEFGLKLKFYADDETEEVFTAVSPERHFNGFPGILHGGIQCAIIDELAFWAMFDKVGKLGVTTRIDMRYLSPVGFDGPLEARAKVLEEKGRTVRVSASIKGANGRNSLKAVVTYGLPDRKTLDAILGEDTLKGKFERYVKE
ncbi:MAG: PaaI family thioesterase [Thermodesulfobacteriota bacterium]